MRIPRLLREQSPQFLPVALVRFLRFPVVRWLWQGNPLEWSVAAKTTLYIL
jgi:hypothetical protein